MEEMSKEELSEFNQESMRFGLLMNLIFWSGSIIVLSVLSLVIYIVYLIIKV